MTTVELHQIDLRMPYAYPQSPPDIRWITPIMHPNVSFSGFVNLADVGIVWTRETPIEMVVERLWDVARGEFVNLDKATNYAAKNWFEKQIEFDLPVDRRGPARPRAGRAARTWSATSGAAAAACNWPAPGGEVMFIDETTPTPKIPERQPIPRRRRGSDEDVIYIGPE